MNQTKQNIAEQFAKDVASHKLKIELDNGVHRSLLLRKPPSSSYWYRIVTYPNGLLITGDMGTYCFERLHDMLEFFRTDREPNLSYWHQKIEANSKHRDSMEFDEEYFDDSIKKYFFEFIRGVYPDSTKEDRRDLYENIQDSILRIDSDRDGVLKQRAAFEFFHKMDCGHEFDLSDFMIDSSFKKFTFDFTWCCYAITHAIKMYDKVKEGIK